MMKVAEISCNHMGSIDTALTIISAAKVRGFNHAKIQVYNADRLWNSKIAPREYIAAKKYQLEKMAISELFKSSELPLFASVFHPRDIDLCEKFDCPIYKIASPEVWNLELIKYASSTKKPIVISLGWAEPNWMGNVLEEVQGRTEVILVLSVPYLQPIDSMEVYNAMQGIEHMFLVPSGISDHSPSLCRYPFKDDVMSYIERHVCIHDTAPDAAFSTNLTKDDYFGEMPEFNFGHQPVYYAATNLPVGHTITDRDILMMRPFHKGTDKSPIGKVTTQAFEKLDPMLTCRLKEQEPS